MFTSVSLGSVAKVISGYAFKSGAFKEGGKIPVLKIKNIKVGTASLDDAGFVNHSFLKTIDSKFQVKQNDILISLTGSHMTQPNSVVGRVGRYPKSFPLALLNQRAGKVIPNEKAVDSNYLFHVLMGDNIRREIAQFAHGAASQANVSPKQVESVQIPLPPLSTQKKIGEALCAYDDLIENNNRRIAILEEIAQSLYREWFVNFRFPRYEQCQMVESPLGPIPEGWELTSLGKLVHFKRNSVKKGTLENPTPYMGLEHFPRMSFALSEWDITTEIGSSKLAFEKGDILFGKIRPYFHKVGVAQTNGLCSSDTFVLSARDSKYSNLIAMVTFSESFVAHAVQTSQGTKMPRANWDVLSEYCVAVPPVNLLNDFNGIVGPAIEQVRVLGAKNRNLKKQRDLLLPKLISGQIDLSQAEQGAA